MNTFKYLSSNEQYINIEFNIDGARIEKRFDIRYVPTSLKEEFDAFCENYLEVYKNGLNLEKQEFFVDPAILENK